MDDLSRRRYIRNLLTGAAGIAVAPWVMLSAKEMFERNGTRNVLQGGLLSRPANYKSNSFLPAKLYANTRAFRLEVSGSKLTEIPSRVAIHSIENHPIQSQLSAAFSRLSDTISLIDWSDEREQAIIELPPRMVFYGHGAFSEDGAILCATVVISTATTTEISASLDDTHAIFVRTTSRHRTFEGPDICACGWAKRKHSRSSSS